MRSLPLLLFLFLLPGSLPFTCPLSFGLSFLFSSFDGVDVFLTFPFEALRVFLTLSFEVLRVLLTLSFEALEELSMVLAHAMLPAE